MNHPRNPLRRTGILLVLAAVFILAAAARPPGTAEAHALLLRADPQADVVLAQSPARVHLWFTENLNISASRIVVWDRYRHSETTGPPTLVPGQGRQMQVGLRPHLAPGAYLVLWTSVSADDGHVWRGSYLFYVQRRGPGPSLAGVATGAGAQGFPDAPTAASILFHWLELLGLTAWAGAVAISLWAFLPLSALLPGARGATERRRLFRLVAASLLMLFLGSCAVLLLEAYGLAGNDWGVAASAATRSAIFDGQYGRLWIFRQVLVLAALLLVLVSGRLAATAGHWKSVLRVEVVLAMVYLVAFAAGGHAASARIDAVGGSWGEVASVSVLVDWFHLAADALWLGGQVYLAAVLLPVLARPGHGHDEVGLAMRVLNRFSPFAYLSVAVFTLSGLFNGKIHIPSWYAFFNSVYGRTLIVKVILIAVMMAISVLTVYFLRPRLRHLLDADADLPGLDQRLSGLVRWLRVNPVLGAAVLLSTSVLFYYPVPAGFSPPGPAQYTASASGITVTVGVKPDRSGPNTITIAVRNATGKPPPAAHIIVLKTMLDMVMGTEPATINQIGPGLFRGTTDLPMGGRWGLRVLVYTPSGLTQIPLVIRIGT